MTELLVAALFLNFGAVASAMVFRTPAHLRSSATNSIAPFLIPLGTLASFFALGIFLYEKGIAYGVLGWFLLSMALAAANSVLRGIAEGLASLFGLISIGVGAALAAHVLF